MAQCKIDTDIINYETKFLKKDIYKHLDNLIALNARGVEYYYYNNGLKRVKICTAIKWFTTANITEVLLAYRFYKFTMKVKKDSKYDIKENQNGKWGTDIRFLINMFDQTDLEIGKCLGITQLTLKIGGGVAQILDNLIVPIFTDEKITYDPRWFTRKSWGDDPYDQLCIEWGCEIYDKYH